jgi:dienelactone hydrolase
VKRVIILIALCVAVLAVPDARADELVQVAPHRAALPFHDGDDTPPLLGFLTRPLGPGRFPAVVLLHWCSGFSGHDTMAATMLKTWGYVALAIDSLGDANQCDGGGGSVSEAFDAFAALRYLDQRNFVASDRVAVMGWSMGGLAAITAIEPGPIMISQHLRFDAAVAYYPPCQSVTGDTTAPLLILIGEKDDWSSPDACRKLAAHESDIGVTRKPGTGAPINLVVYPNATHSFDSDHPPVVYLGHSLRFDPDATRDAEAKLRAFLRERIGDQAETQ